LNGAGNGCQKFKLTKEYQMRKKLVITALVGVVVGYMAQNYVRKIPVVNKLPVIA